MKEEESLMYLGYMLSSKGENMIKNYSQTKQVYWNSKTNYKTNESLGPYSFKSAFIYIESLIRSTILYASEAMRSTSKRRSIECWNLLKNQAFKKSSKLWKMVQGIWCTWRLEWYLQRIKYIHRCWTFYSTAYFNQMSPCCKLW